MEQNHIPALTEAPADESALPSTLSGSDEPKRRRHRHDGWTPERQVIFLEALAAGGCVAGACREAGLSTQSAYSFRNRRSGRAFGTAWDAVLIHRARARLSDEVQSRAINGCTETIRQNGEVVAERHRFDNRLSMAVLTRLDHLAERRGDQEHVLRAVSEDFEDFLDCVEQGGDADAFIDARRPEQPAQAPDRLAADFHPVWTDEEGRRWTAFPPPADFEGEEEGQYDGVRFYARTLSPEEEAVLERELEEMRLEDRAERDQYFGFASHGARTASSGGPGFATDRSNPWQSSTSSTYREGGGASGG